MIPAAAATPSTSEQCFGDQRGEEQKRSYLKPFDCYRTVLCLSVVAHHVVFYSACAYPERPFPWEHGSPLFKFLAWSAFPSVDVFFLMSGFFCARGLLADHSPCLVASRLGRRVARFWRMDALLVGLALLGRRDPRFFTSAETVDWRRVIMLFVAKNYHGGYRGWVDLTTTPTWSNNVDLHASVLLTAAILAGLRYPPPLFERRLAAVALTGAVLCSLVRLSILRENPECLRPACLDISAILTAPGDAASPGRYLGLTLVRRPLACSCPLDNAEFLEEWAVKLYIPTHARLAPFFVGVALAAALKDAQGSSNNKPILKFLALGFSMLWAAERHALPVPVALSSYLPWMMLAAAGSLLDSLAWAVVMFAAVAPKGHWLQSEVIRRASSAEVFALPSKLSFAVYCLHWPVLMTTLRYVRVPLNPYAAFILVFSITLLATTLCALVYENAEKRLARCWIRQQRSGVDQTKTE